LVLNEISQFQIEDNFRIKFKKKIKERLLLKVDNQKRRNHLKS